MTGDVKRKALVFLLLAVIVIVTIAASLPQLELSPGIPLPVIEGAPGELPTESAPILSISVNTFVRAILLLALTLGLAYCGYRMLKGTPLKDLLRPILSIMAWGGLALVILFILFTLSAIRITPEPVEMEILPPALDIKGPPLGPLHPFFIWLAWIGLGLVTALLGVWLIRWRAQRSRSGDPLTLEAERAVRALRAGLDLKNVIIRCYRQMSLALQKEQGIELEKTMTAREFECLLEARGIPHAPVHQLTQLFEAARYGHQSPAPGDEEKAFDCLKAIVQHTREVKKAASR